MQKKRRRDWKIHYVVDESDTSYFLDGMCDAHTHGLRRYGSLEFQLVLNYPPEVIGHLLNEIGGRVASGETYKDGDYIDDILEDGARISVYETVDQFGEPILRLIMPDKDMQPPEKSEEYPYYLQYSSPYSQAMS